MASKKEELEVLYCDECGMKLSDHDAWETERNNLRCVVCRKDLCFSCFEVTCGETFCKECYKKYDQEIKALTQLRTAEWTEVLAAKKKYQTEFSKLIEDIKEKETAREKDGHQPER